MGRPAYPLVAETGRRCVGCDGSGLFPVRVQGGRVGLHSLCNECLALRDRRSKRATRKPRTAADRRLEHERAAARPDAAQRRAAHDAVARALRSGKLVRRPCSTCGASRAHAHHHNGYGREHRLDVAWLCPACHGAEHRRERPVVPAAEVITSNAGKLATRGVWDSATGVMGDGAPVKRRERKGHPASWPSNEGSDEP